MYFLGQAGNYRAFDILRHTFAIGTPRASRKLREHLASRYHTSPENIFLYNNGRSALAAGLASVISESSAVPRSESAKNNAPKTSARSQSSAVKTSDRPEVIITALTCYAVVEAVRAAGCTPVFADVDRETLHFNASTLETALKKHKNACAVIVQNNLGIPVDIVAIERICKKHDIILIEDLAHCAGVRYPDGREAGTVGAFAALSFGKGKSIDTITGGALVLPEPKKSTRTRQNPGKPSESPATPGHRPAAPTSRPRLASSARARLYPLFGATIRGFYHFNLGRHFTGLLLKLHLIERSADAPLDLNTRLTHWQARLALRQLRRLPKEGRPPLREFYLVDDQISVLKELERNGYIFSDTWYDSPVSPDRYYHKANFPEKDCPVAVELAHEIINLPTHYSREKLKPARQIVRRHSLENKIATTQKSPKTRQSPSESSVKITKTQTPKEQV